MTFQWRTKGTRRKPNPKAALRDKLDRACALVVKVRDHFTCQRCSNYIGPTQALHWSHHFGRGHLATRWDLNNTDAHCYGCHRWLGRHPREFETWKRHQLGDEAFDRLDALHHTTQHWTVEQMQYLLDQFVGFLDQHLDEIVQHGAEKQYAWVKTAWERDQRKRA